MYKLPEILRGGFSHILTENLKNEAESNEIGPRDRSQLFATRCMYGTDDRNVDEEFLRDSSAVIAI